MNTKKLKSFIFENKKIIILLLTTFVLSFFLGMEYQKYLIREAISEVFNRSNPFSNESSKESDNTNDNNSKKDLSYMDKLRNENTIIEKNIGDEVELATLKLKVISVDELKVVNKRFGSPEVAPEGSKYVALKIEVTNLTKENFTFDGAGSLVDQDERVFTRELVQSTNDILYTDLKPSIKVTGNIYHLMPEDSKSYSWVVLKSGTNEAYKINLK